jgi:hypothetical protein
MLFFDRGPVQKGRKNTHTSVGIKLAVNACKTGSDPSGRVGGEVSVAFSDAQFVIRLGDQESPAHREKPYRTLLTV